MLCVAQQTICRCTPRYIWSRRFYSHFQQMVPGISWKGTHFKAVRLIGNISQDFLKGTKGKTMDKLMKQYKVGDGFKLVYISNFSNYILMVQATSFFLGLYPALLVLGNYCFVPHLENVVSIIFETPMQKTIGCIVGTTLFFLCYLVTRKIPTRIYFNETTNKFKILWHSLIPTQVHLMECAAGQGTELAHGNKIIRLILKGNCHVSGKNFIILEQFFSYPVYYNKLFGY